MSATIWQKSDWPMVGEPSLISTTAAGAFLPSAPAGNEVAAASALSIALPVAVPPPIDNASTAASTGV